MNSALFRPGTSDRNIWKSVVEGDEYRLPQMGANDLCLDVGANTGAATYAMLQKGAGKVIAFEPDPDNFLLFRKQLKAEIRGGRVEAYNVAVVGGSGFEWRIFSGVVKKDGEINHGGAYTFNRDGSDPLGYGQYFVNKPFRVPCIGFDEVLRMAPSPRLVKLDCEGSEFEILQGNYSKAFLPAQIVGEYHPHGTNTLAYLLEGLSLAGYETKTQPHENSALGLFFATRK